MDSQGNGHSKPSRTSLPLSADIFEPSSSSNAKSRASLIEWMNSLLPSLHLSVNASDEELRALLVDGSVLCQLLNKLKPGSVNEHSSSGKSATNTDKFFLAMDVMGLPKFQKVELEKGSMKIVLDCLLTLRTHFMSSSDERRKSNVDSKHHRALESPIMSGPSSPVRPHSGNKQQEVFQPKQSTYADILKTSNFDSAPTQSLLTVVNGILDDNGICKNGEIPHRMSSMLRKVVQEIERRIYTQNEHLKMQNSSFRAREEKYQSRIRVLEALGEHTKTESPKNDGKNKDTEQVLVRLKQENDEHSQTIKALKQELEVARKTNEKSRKDEHSQEIAALKEELQVARNTNEKKSKDENSKEIASVKQELEVARTTNEKSMKDEYSQEIAALKKELQVARDTNAKKINDETSREIASLKQELEAAKKTSEQKCSQIEKDSKEAQRKYEEKCSQIEKDAKEAQRKYEEKSSQIEKDAKEAQSTYEEKLKELVDNLTESRSKVKELQESSAAKSERWSKKENIYHIFTDFQLGALQELRYSSQAIKQEVVKTQKSYSQESSQLGQQIRELQEAAKNYYAVLVENRKLHNELQELKGNIRVYCRIRPFLPRQKEKNSTLEPVGDNGELVVVNPAKPGKEGRKMFKFNKVYGPPATQGDVFSDIQPFVQSVMDGFNVCIFAYGQTGAGKTYTMMGPEGAKEEEWGVNYRALSDLFRISKSRESKFTYEISVQMIEIYNETVRDLLLVGSPQKKLGVLSNSQGSGLTVPDASMFPVKTTFDVLELMNLGLKKASKSSTALNERSSRSHSVITIHVHGTDLKTGSSMRSSLNLVDLAGSERIDRSEVTGDRLKEAQHINKSLSALGDVIFALAQKGSHIPYRNSKLTQVLQSSLGGKAKTLMFVQLNPDTNSYSETFSTLKFAERVSGVELGAAKSSKDGKDVRDLMEQVATLKDTIAKKDEEIERLELHKN